MFIKIGDHIGLILANLKKMGALNLIIKFKKNNLSIKVLFKV